MSDRNSNAREAGSSAGARVDETQTQPNSQQPTAQPNHWQWLEGSAGWSPDRLPWITIYGSHFAGSFVRHAPLRGLADEQLTGDKSASRYWVPGAVCVNSTQRCDANSAGVAYFVGDNDGPLAPERLTGTLWLAHASHSHRPGSERWRVVIPYSRPVSPAEHRQIWPIARERYCPVASPSACSAPSHGYYLPPPSATWHGGSGKPIDVDGLLNEAKERGASKSDAVLLMPPPPSVRQDASRDSEIAKAFAGIWQPQTTGEDALGGLGGVLCRSGVSAARATAIAAELAQLTQSKHRDPVGRVLQAYRGKHQLGWPTLRGALESNGGGLPDGAGLNAFALTVGNVLDDVSALLSASVDAPTQPQQAATSQAPKLQASAAAPASSRWHERTSMLRLTRSDLCPPGIEVSHPRKHVPIHEIVNHSIEALADAKVVYQRDGRLVRAQEVELPTGKRDPDGKPLRTQTLGIAALAPAVTLLELSKAADYWNGRFTKNEGEVWERTDPPPQVAQAVHAAGRWPGVRPLVGVISAPTLRVDGSILQAPGYDDATGLIYQPDCAFPPVPESPTQAEASAALSALRLPFAEFPFEREADRDVAVAMILTLIGRPAIDGNLPALVFDAAAAGTGKTLVADAAALIATGKPVGKCTFPSDEAELEKMLGAYALAGARLIGFDNLSGPFDGAPLCKVLTANGQVQLRVLGKSEMPLMSWHALVVAGGNNVTISGDTIRRVLRARMVANVERPEERTGFRITNLSEWCLRERPRLVIAALTILRGYFIAGRPRQAVRRIGSYEQFCDLIASAIAWAGGSDITQCRVESAADPKAEAANELFCGLAELTGSGALSAKQIIQQVFSPVHPGAAPIQDALREIMLAKPGMPFAPSAHALGKCLQRFKDQVRGKLQLKATSDLHTKVQMWQVLQLS